jgi:hypothetical protein
MRKAPKKRSGTGKPVKRVSAIKRKKSGSTTRHYLVRSWWILRGAAVGALVLVLLYGAYLGFGKIMGLESLSVRIIEVDGCQAVQPENIRRLAGVAKGDPLLRVDLKEVRRKVVSHPSVKDATVVRELPDTLRISVRERAPTAVVIGRKFALVDSEGVVLGLHASYPDGYPVITGITGSHEPGRVIAQARPALDVLRDISLSGYIGPEGISEIGVDQGTVRVSLMGTGMVLILGHGDTRAQLGRLARLVEAGVFDTRLAGYDLRFEGRVIGVPGREFDVPGAGGLPPAGG